MFESLNVTPGEFPAFDPFLEVLSETTPPMIRDDDGTTSTTSAETTTSTTIPFENPTETETTTPNIEPPIAEHPKCTVQVGTVNCLISCVEIESVNLTSELTRTINEDIIVSICVKIEGFVDRLIINKEVAHRVTILARPNSFLSQTFL